MRQVNKKKTKTVLVFGVFDLLHPGHIYFLKQAKKLGKKLIVIVSRDKVVKARKNIYPVEQEKIRLSHIKKLKFVNRVLLGNNNPQHNYNLVKIIKPQMIAVSYDQKPSLLIINRDLKKIGLNPILKRLPAYRPLKYKSSLIKINRTLV